MDLDLVEDASLKGSSCDVGATDLDIPVAGGSLRLQPGLPGVDLEHFGTGDNALAQLGGGEPARVGHVRIECRLVTELDHLHFDWSIARALSAHARHHEGAVLGKKSEHCVFVGRQPFLLAGVAPEEHAEGQRISGPGCTDLGVMVRRPHSAAR